jgi:hypothetical protein
MQSAKTGGKKEIPPRRRGKHGQSSEHHKTKPHDRQDGDRKRTAADDSRSIQQKPSRRKCRVETRTE